MGAGDSKAGKERANSCVACHGVAGNSVNPLYPSLAGQSDAYLVKQLKAFKSGDRKDPVMSAMATPLSDKDIENLAAYFSSSKSGGKSLEESKGEKAKTMEQTGRYEGAPSGISSSDIVYKDVPKGVRFQKGNLKSQIKFILKDVRAVTVSFEKGQLENLLQRTSHVSWEQNI